MNSPTDLRSRLPTAQDFQEPTKRGLDADEFQTNSKRLPWNHSLVAGMEEFQWRASDSYKKRAPHTPSEMLSGIIATLGGGTRPNQTSPARSDQTTIVTINSG